MHAWCLQRPAEDTGSPELGSQIVANCLVLLGLELTSPEEQPVLLTAHPSLQPQTTVLGPGLHAASLLTDHLLLFAMLTAFLPNFNVF